MKSKHYQDIGMRFQARDTAILQTIYDYDGVLARRHIQSMFWPGRSKRVMDRRLSLLNQNGFIQWPNALHHRTKPIPEPIVWLDWRGALLVAGTRGVNTETPARVNENQLRRLQTRLREQGIRWLRDPRWSLLSHDLHVIDFRLTVEQAVGEDSGFVLLEWINESVFRSHPDVINFSLNSQSDRFVQKKKGVCPDGCFVISVENRRKKDVPHRARFLLELDMGTHDTVSFGIEKMAAGAAYIRSSEYKRRFGANTGRWLVVTTGETRMQNLMRQTKQRVENDASIFYFTTLEKFTRSNPLRDHIWRQVDNDNFISIFPEARGL